MLSLNLLLFVLIIQPAQAQTDPLGLMLTWQQDPSTTMTIDWYTSGEVQASFIEFRKLSDADEEWIIVDGEFFPFPFSDRRIHRVEVTGLKPDTEYHFRIGDYSRVRKFRTMPENAIRPVRIAVGGDVRHRIEWMEQTNRRAAQYEPDFVLWGGDLAYANGMDDRVETWYEFLDATMRTLITADGRMIPVVTTIGNHEVRGGYFDRDDHESREGFPLFEGTEEDKERISPYFYQLFPFPGQPGYGVLDFGDYMSIILLDTGHNNPMDGEQKEWLETILAERRDVPHVFPTYHVPAFPSVRSPDWESSVQVREHWVPLFEENGVRVVFESHDHSYKRTFPLKENQIASDGITYIGDGAWGVGVREIGRSHEQHAWYLDRAASERHFILTTIHGTHQHFLTINENGQIIDEYPRTPHIDLNSVRLAEPWFPEVITDPENEE